MTRRRARTKDADIPECLKRRRGWVVVPSPSVPVTRFSPANYSQSLGQGQREVDCRVNARFSRVARSLLILYAVEYSTRIVSFRQNKCCSLNLSFRVLHTSGLRATSSEGGGGGRSNRIWFNRLSICTICYLDIRNIFPKFVLNRNDTTDSLT